MTTAPPMPKTSSPTSLPCPRCKTRKLLVREGKKGRFLSCHGYPGCKVTLEYNRLDEFCKGFEDGGIGWPPDVVEKWGKSETDGLLSHIPPFDLSLEAGTIGSLIIDPQIVGSILAILPSADAFSHEPNQIIYRLVVDLFENNKPIDAMILHTTLKAKNLLTEVGGIEYIVDLANAVPTSAHAEHYAVKVRELWQRRMMISAASAILQDCYNTDDESSALVDRSESRIFEASCQTLTTNNEATLSENLHEAFEAMDRRQGDGPQGIPTGWRDLDIITDGLHPQEMIVIAARPSAGKTALAMGIAEHVGVDLKLPVGVFSLEMSKQQLCQRLLSSRSGVSSHLIRRGMLNKQHRDQLTFAVGELAQGNIYINDQPSLTITELRTAARRMVKRFGVKLFIIDYLQLMDSSGRAENRQQEITKISRGVKALARELNVPIICLSQLNRASETENRLPRASDLRESGAIEQDSDVVMLLHREAMMHRGDDEWAAQNAEKINEALLIVAKQRNGPCENVKLVFQDACTRFVTKYSGSEVTV